MIELGKLCDEGMRESLASPFSFQLDGAWWNAATDGHALLAIREGIGELKRDNSPPAVQLFSDKLHTHTVRFPALASWLRESQPAMSCWHCNGAGSVEHSCACDLCDRNGERIECHFCEGDKTLKNQEPFAFENLEFDRVILAKFMEPVLDSVGSVTMHTAGELDPIEFRGADWRLVVMPRRPEPEKVSPAVPGGIFTAVGS